MANPVARINLDALRHNFQRVRALAPQSPIFAVIKANAYGHGMLPVAKALQDLTEGFALARVEEAVQLRREGLSQRLLVMSGLMHPAEFAMASQHQLELVVHDASQLEMLNQPLPAATDPVAVWIKVDTGMHRLGFSPARVAAVREQLAHMPQLRLVGMLSHFANADDLADSSTTAQIHAFAECHATGLELSLANSAAVLGWPQSHLGWLRPGIMLYGATPFISGTAADLELQPVMTLRTRLIALHNRRAGDPIGYGASWRCPEDMRIGVAAIGYGDGYPRHAPSGTPVLVNGQRAALAGRVSMDLITIDLRQVAQASVGDQVILWGEGLPVEDIAAHVGTISYELLCRPTGRVKYRYEGMH